MIARFLNHSRRRFICWATLPAGLAFAAGALATLGSSSPQGAPPPYSLKSAKSTDSHFPLAISPDPLSLGVIASRSNRGRQDHDAQFGVGGGHGRTDRDLLSMPRSWPRAGEDRSGQLWGVDRTVRPGRRAELSREARDRPDRPRAGRAGCLSDTSLRRSQSGNLSGLALSGRRVPPISKHRQSPWGESR